MEDLLHQIVKDTSSNKFSNIRKAAQDAYDFLESQQGSSRASVCQLREKCLEPIQLTLESRSSKLISYGIGGLQRLLRDNRFHSNFENEKEELWLPMQVLRAVSVLPSLPDDTQVEILKILLNITCSTEWIINVSVITRIAEVCLSTFMNNNQASIKTAAKATCTQMLSTFCQHLNEELSAELKADVSDPLSDLGRLGSDIPTIFDDIVSLLAFFCEKITSVESNNLSKLVLPIVLQSIHTILSNTSPLIHQNNKFIDLSWQQLCPSLIMILGNPRTDKNIVSSQKSGSSETNEIGRGSGCLAAAPSFLSTEARSIYCISVELVRLVGSVNTLRPVIGSLLHRMLLYPPPQHRLEALKSVREVLNSPERLLDLAGPANPDYSNKNSEPSGTNIALLKLIVDSVVECCHCTDTSVCTTSVGCMVALLNSIEQFCNGNGIKSFHVEQINKQQQLVEARLLEERLTRECPGTIQNALNLSMPEDVDSYSDYEGDCQVAVNGFIEPDCDDSSRNGELVLSVLADQKTTLAEANSDVEGVESQSEKIVFHREQKNEEIDLAETKLLNKIIKEEEDEETFQKEEKDSGDELINEFEDEDDDNDDDNNVLWSSLKRKQKDLMNRVNEQVEYIALPRKGSTSSSVESKDSPKRTINTLVDAAESSKNIKANDTSDYLPQKPYQAHSGDSKDSPKKFSKTSLENRDSPQRTFRTSSVDSRFSPKKLSRASSFDKDGRSSQCEMRNEFIEIERNNARYFISCLKNLLPKVLMIRSSIETDEALKQFASSYCQDVMEQPRNDHKEDRTLSQITIVNADGIYLATYSALLLNLKLLRRGYYENDLVEIPLSEKEFIEEVLCSDMIVYLSAIWLSEVYAQILLKNLLYDSGYDTNQVTNSALINLLTDIDGLGSFEYGGQLLSDYTRLEKAAVNVQKSSEVEAGMLFGGLVLSSCWNGILEVLSVILNGKNSCGIASSLAVLLGTEGAKEENRKVTEAICMSLDGLQKAARLSNILGLQSRCGSVFAQLANSSCLTEEIRKSLALETKLLKASGLPAKGKQMRLHTAHVLSMDLILCCGLEMGSHSSECWKHIFRCCTYIAQHEHLFFSSGNNHPNKLKLQKSKSTETPNSDEFGESEMMNFNMMSNSSTADPQLTVTDLIKEHSKESGWDAIGGGILNPIQTSKVLWILSSQVDRLFEVASSKLNLKALLSFLNELCIASHAQLSSLSGAARSGSNSLLLFRLGDVMLKCVRSGRPLLHIMKAWSVTFSHFVEAACNKDRTIAKKSVTCIHDIVTALMGMQSELPHFHFNEALFKPFENLLCLELCDTDVQDQIVCCICEFVEGCTSEIRSGWRPLFGALRAVRVPTSACVDDAEAQFKHVRAVLDVFEAFLSTDNVLVFANAAVDCILCLLKYVRGPGELELLDDNSDSEDEVPYPSKLNLCLPALKYLQRCSSILASMYLMPACPVFHSAHRIKLNTVPQCVSPILPTMDLEQFEKTFRNLCLSSSPKSPPQSPSHEVLENKEVSTVTERNELHNGGVESNIDDDNHTDDEPGTPKCQTFEGSPDLCPEKGSLEVKEAEENNKSPEQSPPVHSGDVDSDSDVSEEPEFHPVSLVTLESIDHNTKILHVWYLLLEGLAGAVVSCPRMYQPQTMETLFDLLKSLIELPGPEFGVYCVNHLLLPMLQAWLRRTSHIYRVWDSNFASNFKQCCGLATDLVVEYLTLCTSDLKSVSSFFFMLNQLFDVLIECVAQPAESISRLGCACIRHILLSSGSVFTEQMWEIACSSLQRAVHVTLYNLQQLMSCFHANSDNFFGDIGQVKVAARKDCTGIECERLHQLAHQVFWLDSQQTRSQGSEEIDDERSYVFLLCPPDVDQTLNPEFYVARIPFRNIVVGLLSHQLLLQTLGCLLLQGTPHTTSSISNILTSGGMASVPATLCSDKPLPEVRNKQLPGMLQYLSTKNVNKLMDCLYQSHVVAIEFDSRPGLKFLLQKVVRADVAANLYKQAAASWTFYMLTQFIIGLHSDCLSVDYVKSILESSPKKRNINQCLTVDHHIEMFLKQFYKTLTDVCQMYIDMVLDKEGFICSADKIADQPLFFLVAQPDDFLELSYKRKHLETMPSLTEIEKQVDPITVKALEELNKQEGKIYTVATEPTIKTLMNEYKKRKQQHSMPSSKTKDASKRKNPFDKEKKKGMETMPEEITKQQKTSIMKDGDARIHAWTEMLMTVLQLLAQLPDEQFKSLVPLTFPNIYLLLCHASDPRLKEALADWVLRIISLVNMAPNNLSLLSSV